MNFTEILKKKSEKSIKLKSKYKFIKKNKALGIIKLEDKSLFKDLRDGLLELPVSFVAEINGVEQVEKIGDNIVAVPKISKIDLVGFDFIICDDNILHLNEYLAKGITPIIVKQSKFGNILKDFNPIKHEGNAYLYEKENKWCIYGALVRYLENFKFPFDNKNLVKNVVNT